MTDSMKDREKALEEAYIQKLEEQTIRKLAERKNSAEIRKSPITGKPMEQITIHGIIVDRCVDSGGIFLDAGELEDIIKASTSAEEGWLEKFIQKLKF